VRLKKIAVPEYIWFISLVVVSITLVILLKQTFSSSTKLLKNVEIKDLRGELIIKKDLLGGLYIEKLRFKLPKGVDLNYYLDNLRLYCFDDPKGILEIKLSEFNKNFLVLDQQGFYTYTKRIHLAGPDDTTILYYSFDDCEYNKNFTKDLSGNNNHGLYNGTPTCTKGIKGKSLLFNKNLVIIPKYKENLFLENSSFTFLVFLKNANGSKIFSKYSYVGPTHKYLGWWIDAKVGNYFRFCVGQDSNLETPCIHLKPLDNLTKNSWLMLTCILNYGEKKFYCYYNLTLQPNIGSITYFYDSNNNFVVGGQRTLTKTYSGYLDELFIFNRVLKPYEIRTMYYFNCTEKGAKWFLFIGDYKDGIKITETEVR